MAIKTSRKRKLKRQRAALLRLERDITKYRAGGDEFLGKLERSLSCFTNLKEKNV